MALLRFPSFGLYEAGPPNQNSERAYITFRARPDGAPVVGSRYGNELIEFGVQAAPLFQSRIYRFLAERFNVGECRFGHSTNLAPNAANLPEVLNSLQANTSKFREFNKLVSTVLPHVRQVSVRPRPNDILQVIVWTVDPETRRDDLAVPLDESGSGVGQVLAILYVAFASPYPQVVLIDEPQSFLHPGAVRRLFEVLGSYSQHQYIVSTHSPTIVSAAEPATITLARLNNGTSVLDNVDPADTRALQLCLAEVGARLSDVFGADNVLWVEGRTEELCYPLILRRVAKKQLMGTAVLGIRATGELERRGAEQVFDIYRRLTKASTLLPPALAFVLDLECRSQDEMKDIGRRCQQPVVFLPRRMYENYLLQPAALCHVMNSIPDFRATGVVAEEVAALIEIKRKDPDNYCRGYAVENGTDWQRHIDAARVLSELFTELSETRVSYDKIRHSVALTEFIIEHSPEELEEIADLLVNLLQDET